MIKAFLTLSPILYLISACVGNSASSKIADNGNHILTFNGKSFENRSIVKILDEKKEQKITTVEFKNCNFSGISSFTGVKDGFSEFPYNCIFENCSFGDDLSGSMTLFKGSVNFSKCRFKKKANFQNATFFSGTGFRDCIFDGPAEFQNSIHFRESTWIGSNFYDIPFFQSAKFYAKAQFMNVVFHGNSDFTICRFSEGGNFDYIRSDGNLDFAESKFEGLTTFRKAYFSKRIVLKNITAFSTIRFIDANFMDSLVTSGAQFFSSKIEIMRPTGTFKHP